MGAAYDVSRSEVEVGVNVSFDEDVSGWVSVRQVTGAADVSSPTRGGEIYVRGTGASLGLRWGGASNYYAAGLLSLSVYDIDLSSDTRGLLKAGVNGSGRTLSAEAGRRFVASEAMTLTPRVTLVHTQLSIDGFTDAVNSRVSYPASDRLTGSLGVMVETEHASADGELSLRGSLDVERIVSGAMTNQTV